MKSGQKFENTEPFSLLFNPLWYLSTSPSPGRKKKKLMQIKYDRNK